MYFSSLLRTVGLTLAWVMSQAGFWYISPGGSAAEYWGRAAMMAWTSAALRPGRVATTSWGAVLILMRAAISVVAKMVAVWNSLGNRSARRFWSLSGLL